MQHEAAERSLVVVGAGILGLAVARELSRRFPERSLMVLEREALVGTQQTGANSGVIHAGVYYAPGSLKARLCVTGAREMYSYCEQRSIPHERCGKVIVATKSREIPQLEALEARGRANAVPGLRMLSSHQLTRIEPHARGVAALHSPETGVVDFGAVARSLAGELERAGVPVVTSCAVLAVRRSPGALLLRHAHGETRARFAVFCAGQDASRLAVAAGASADPRIVGFRGRYRYLRPERRELVRGLIYPVPDPRLPFLGVHLTRHVDGNVSLGPTATPEPRTPGDLAWPGTWRMARRFWRAGGAEIRRSLSERAMTRPARSYLPGIRTRDLEGGFSGLRAQAVARDGRLVDDFAVSETEHALHVRNAPSPAATAAFALARLIVDRAAPRLD